MRYNCNVSEAHMSKTAVVLRVQLEASLTVTPRLVAKAAAELRREAELMYDGPIPRDVLAAIEAQADEERAGLVKVAPRPEPGLRQRARLEFYLAKECFRHVVWNTYGPRGSQGAERFRRQQRRFASEHLEAWAGFRRMERQALEAA
jgi:hypothetical protein